MQILVKKITKSELRGLAVKMFGNFVKAVVDIEREAIAIDGELHVDLAEMLVREGSKNKNIWGINIYLDDRKDWLEFDSMINLKPQFQNRTRGVDDPDARKKIATVVKNFVDL